MSAVSINDVAVLEGDAGTTNAVFTITLSAPSAQTVTLVATSADGSATTPPDYLALPPTAVTFAPGETSKTVTVPINGDTDVEANETFTVNLTAVVNATVADGQGLGTIINDDSPLPVLPPPTLSINDVTLVEGTAGVTNAVFTVTLSSPSTQVVTVLASSADGTATTPSDYVVLPPALLTFAPGTTTMIVTVPVVGDATVEPDENFVVDLSAPINATLADAQGLGTILNDDPGAPILVQSSISIADVGILEGDVGTTDVVFTITLSSASALPVTVTASSADGTATTPADYLLLPPTIVTFAPGETSKTVTVTVNGDVLVEGNETFVVDLTLPVNATLADNQATGTIIDDDAGVPVDPLATLSISDVTIVEGNVGTTNAVFTVTLSAASALPVTVIASSADGTATTPGDYLLLPPTMLTFAPGETTKTVSVAINGDLLVEGNENFFVNLVAPVNATISDAQGVGTILDDDPVAPVLSTPSISIGDVAVLEGNVGTTNAVFTITLSGPSAQTVTVLASTTDGTASNLSDYIALAPTLVTFAPGETSKTVTVLVNGDVIQESDETFTVDLAAPINATLADSQGLGTIVNDDGVPPVFPDPNLTISDVTLVEGDAGVTNAVFTVTLSAASAQTVTVLASSADGTATTPLDYLLLPPTLLTFLPGQTTMTVTVPVNGDTLSEPDETFFVNLTAPINATLADDQAMGTILDDDVVPTLSVDDVTLVEGDAGVTNAVFTITLSATSGQTVTVLASSADGTATTPSDYILLPPTLVTFLPGQTTMTVTVPVVGDTLSEADETFFVNLSTPVNATIADNQGLGTITDDDIAPTLSIDDVTVVEGDAGVTNAVFTITLSAASGQAVTVLASSSDGTATTPLDYIILPPTLVTFAPGVTTMTVTVPVNGDTVSEADETFFVDLSTPINATIADNQGLGTITNDDVAPTLSINDVTLVEGDVGVTNAVFTITLSAASGQAVTVLASSADGTATTPADYILLPPTLVTFAPGVTTMTVTVPVNGDTLSETDETFFVDLTTPINATIADNQGLGTIVDDDVDPTLSINDVTLVEGDAGVTNAVFTVTLSAASGQAVTVLASSADGTATTPSDYLLLPPTLLTFAPGVTTMTVTVPVNGDTLSEADETFFVNLATPLNATITDNQGLGTIINDDTAPTLSIDDVSVVEGNAGVTNAVFTITLSAPSGQAVTVLASSANGPATTPSDYILLPPTLVTFAPGETTKTITVVVNGDTLSETDETFFVNLTTPINATIADNQGVGTIINDDAVPTLSINDVIVVEGDVGTTNAVFTITLSAPSGQAVTVLASSADGTATTPSDYLLLPPTLVTFAPGETTKTITVPINGDTLSEADETFFVDLTTPINATITDNQGLATIVDDDVAPTLSIDDVTIVEGDAGVTTAVFTVTLSAASGQAVTVLASSTDGTATTPSDYVLPPTLVTFAPGETTKTISVVINGDTLSEADETFFVDLTTPINATIADNQGLATITNDDTAPTVSIDDVTVVEGNAGVTTAVFTVSLSAASGQAVTVLATSADGTATSPSDYILLPPTLITFAPGETTKTITVTVNGDVLSETDETFFVNLTTPLNATIADDQGVGTITNDDVTPTVSIDDVVVAEGNLGTTNAVFTVTLSAPSGQVVTVLVSSADGTATTPSDYLLLPPTLVTFAPGETTKTVTVAVNGDTLSEGSENFFVNVNTPINATITDNQGLGTIVDDDVVPTLSVNDVTVVEGNAGTTNAVFTVTLSAPSGQAVTALASSADGTATTPSDYLLLPPTLVTFAPGETTKTVTVPINGDTVSEANETFFINLTAPVNATIADNQGLGTITNDDAAPTLSISDATVLEGNAGTTDAVFTVTLSAASGQPVTILASSSAGTATATSDYIEFPPTLITFAPGETTKTVTVAVNGDTLVEGNETFFVNLTAPVNATVADGLAVGTITNDDTATVTISKITDGAEANTPSNGKFRVTQSAVSSTDTVINYSISGTATSGAGNDYGTLSGTVTIPAGQTTADIDVNVFNDSVVEDTESVIVTLTSLGAHNPAVVLGALPANLTATVNITDDDPPVITSPSSVTVPENTPATTVVLDVNATPIAGHTFVYTLSGPDAAQFTINPATGEIRFAASPDFDAPVDVGANNVYNVTVTATADFIPTRSVSQDVTITVTPLNDLPPVFVDASPVFSLPENAPVGTVVGTVTANDADSPANSVTYSIISGNESGAFAIDPVTGQITVVNSAVLNFEVNPAFTLIVRATDNGNPVQTADAVVVINLTNVAEGPLITVQNHGDIFQIGQRPIVVASDATFTYGDVVTPNFTNSKLTVSIVAGRTRGDRLSILHKGDETNNPIKTRGRKVFSGGEQIGTFVPGGTARHPNLVVTFYGNATSQDVQDLLQRVSFHAITGAGTVRTVNLQVTNINGVDSNVATRDITVLSHR